MKNLSKRQKPSGFTIIEVMIVLAIAGLIMVIVFIAVPQLQRNQRDNARQNVVNRLKAEMDTYASNNQGKYPFRTSGETMADFMSRYITDKVKIENPRTGENYTIAIAGNAAANPSPSDIFVYPGMSCQGEGTTGTFQGASSTNNQRQYAIRVQLDRTNTYYCVDNG